MPAPEASPTRLAPTLPRYVDGARRALDVLTARPLATLGALVIAHWVAVAVFALTVRRNGWLFYQSGEQIWLLTTGWLLGSGDLAPTSTGYGWPLVVAPLMRFTGPSFVAAMPPVIALNLVVLAPIALWAVYGLAARIAGRAFGLLAAAVWVVLPFAVIPLWRDDYHERYVEQFLPGALGLTGLADYPSMILLLVGALLFVRALDTGAPLDAGAAGLCAGFAIGVKPSNVLFLAAPLVAAALARNVRVLLPFGLAVLPALLTLALWKQRGLGTLPSLAPDRYVDLDWTNLHANAGNLREYFWSARLLEWLPLAGAVGVARRSPALAGLLGTWFVAFLVVKGTTPLATVSSGSFFRFMMPAYPAYFLLAVSTLLLVPTLGVRLARGWPEGRLRRLDRRIVAAIAVGLALVPLLVVALARPIDSGAKAVVVQGILTPVDEQIDVELRAAGTARMLTWTHPRAGSSDVFYRVFRTDLSGTDVDCSARDGARECRLRMVPLGTTREQRWRDVSSPAGSRYRVAVAASSRDDPAAGDIATISAPVPGDR